jgi:hypothetical protein
MGAGLAMGLGVSYSTTVLNLTPCSHHHDDGGRFVKKRKKKVNKKAAGLLVFPSRGPSRFSLHLCAVFEIDPVIDGDG